MQELSLSVCVTFFKPTYRYLYTKSNTQIIAQSTRSMSCTIRSEINKPINVKWSAPRAAKHTHRHCTPTPWDEVSIWTSKVWDNHLWRYTASLNCSAACITMYRVDQKIGPILTVNNFHYKWQTIDQMVPRFAGKQLLCDSVVLLVSHLLNIPRKLNAAARSSFSFCPTVRRR